MREKKQPACYAISLDTETTGVDRKHGARPFLVTTSDESYNNKYWEWSVNTNTREVEAPKHEVEEVLHEVEQASELILQHSKFDVAMLTELGRDLGIEFEWPWGKTHDTLVSGHLLASNHGHSLEDMAIEYLGVDMSRYEKRMEKAVKACRSFVQRKNSPISDWRIARKHMEGMPSAKESCWKFDLWILREFVWWARTLKPMEEWSLPEGWEDWEDLTAEYANTDSSTTFALHLAHKKELEERDLWSYYQARMEMLPSVFAAEDRGITLNRVRLEELDNKYRKEIERCGRICTNIAAGYDFELKLPKSGKNNSLSEFVFDVMELPVVKRSTKTGKPSMDAKVLEQYLTDLPPRSKQLMFVQQLSDFRKRATAVGYMESYQRFWIPMDSTNDWYVLFPSLNPTGTNTLRFSSNNPNEQNISKKEGFNLRYTFGPAPGREWWSLDANNIELRIPAYESQEQELIDLFERSDEPPYYGSNHLLNFHTVYPDIWEKELRVVGPEEVGKRCKKKYASTWYQWCKNGGFAVQYGAVDREDGEGTADKAFHMPGAHSLLKERFGNLETLNQTQVDMANELGFVETLPDRTVDSNKGYPLLCTRSQWGGVKPTIPLNYHVQGSACWVMMRCMIKIYNYLQELNQKVGEPLYFLIMQIHDEVVLDFPFKKNKGNLPIVRHIQKLMEEIGDDLVPRIPLPVGIEYHPNNWAEGEMVA